MRLRRVGVGSLLLALLACGAEPAPPNLVVYLVDTLRADHLGVYGYARETSPHLDAFAADAVVYENAYAPSSWTRPSTATLLTGRSPLAHGAVGRADALDPSVPLLGEALKQAGYATAAFVTNVNVLPTWGFGRGFDVFRDVDSESGSARSTAVNEAVFRHLTALRGGPFFVYLHTRDPHVPHAAPPPFDSLWPTGEGAPVENGYDAEVRANDDSFGALLERLRERGVYDQTLVVFTSDHGEELRERGELGHGHSLFEELVRVPLLIKYPGAARAGTRVAAPVSLVDLAPTLLGVAEAAAPGGLEGLDLRGALPDERALFFDQNLLLKGRRHVLEGVLLGRHKLVLRAEPEPRRQLFDLARDPRERQPLAASDVEARLAERLRSAHDGARGGLHLLWVGAPRAEPLQAELRLRTGGRFVELRRFGFESGDEAVLSESGRELRVRVRLPARRNPSGGRPRLLVDGDRVAVGVEPPDAPVSVEVASLDGAAAQIFLGRERASRGEAPQSFRGDAPELRVERMDTLLPTSAKRSVEAPAGLYVGVVPRRGRALEIDAETERRLRELGYAE